MKLLAVDVGGTKIACALVTRDGGILDKRQQPTDLSGPQAVAEQIARYYRSLPEQPAAVGISLPAVLESGTDRVVWAPNLPGWRDVPFREMLQAQLGLPVVMEYDGHAAVLGEWWKGAAQGYQHVVSVIIGTGIGGGMIIEGRLWRGRDRLAGTCGWFPMAGADGLDHWENLAAGPAIAHRARQLIGTGRSSVLSSDPVTAKSVFDAARQGDELARDVVREAAECIGRGVATIISLANPEIIVLGGSVGQQGDLLLDTVRDTAIRWAQPISSRDVRIVSSVLGEEAGLLGAAYAAFSSLA
ncbi:MAG: ROK family protein [Planctomycetaceae bacterium]|nr:MAG: ROK family protein [Planctomycetaceae bacterium]